MTKTVRAASGTLGPMLGRSADASAVFATHGVDVDRVRRMYPPALRYDSIRILTTIDALKALSVDHAKALDRNPRVWSYHPQGWDERLAVLQRLKLDDAKIIVTCPSLLGLPPGTLRAKVEALQGMGLDATKVVRHCPNSLTFCEERIRGTASFLDSVGLDGVRVINACPTILNSKATKLQPVVHFVTATIGRTVTVLHKYPARFRYSLNGRLVPRYQFAVLHHKDHLSLGALFTPNDERFAKTMGQPLTAYREFVAERVPK